MALYESPNAKYPLADTVPLIGIHSPVSTDMPISSSHNGYDRLPSLGDQPESTGDQPKRGFFIRLNSVANS
eukprot:scaffold25166_cov79-Cyclotella_meneghiniana.AAC.3